MLLESFINAQIDILKVIESSEDYCAPVVLLTNIGNAAPLEIGTEGEPIDVRELLQGLSSISKGPGSERSYWFEGIRISKTRAHLLGFDTRFEGKVLFATIQWGS